MREAGNGGEGRLGGREKLDWRGQVGQQYKLFENVLKIIANSPLVLYKVYVCFRFL